MINSNYVEHWDQKFKNRSWGEYPPEDLIRFVKRNFPENKENSYRVLELGCGPGANIIFFRREGFKVSAIDISPNAIDRATNRLLENNLYSDSNIDLKVGNFKELPWEDNSFDLIIDNFAVYANTKSVIADVVKEQYRVMKKGGLGFAKFWGINTTGYGQGELIEENTYDNIPSGPCKDMGFAHFVHYEELECLFSNFINVIIDKINRTDKFKNCVIEEYMCSYQK